MPATNRVEQPSGSARREPLSRVAIVDAALALLDDSGFDGLSMRNLAARLGIKAASLYWYVRDKQELLGLVADAICAGIEPLDAKQAWRSRLETFGLAYRRLLLSHRDAALICALTVPSGPNRLRLADLGLGAIIAAGFEGLDAVRAGRLVADYVESFVQDETREADFLAALEYGDDTVLRMGREFAEAQVGDYPHIAALAPFLPDMDRDARFAFGMRVLLDGLERARPLRRRTPGTSAAGPPRGRSNGERIDG